jgi:lysophospholipase L1-like esterase
MTGVSAKFGQTACAQEAGPAPRPRTAEFFFLQDVIDVPGKQIPWPDDIISPGVARHCVSYSGTLTDTDIGEDSYVGCAAGWHRATGRNFNRHVLGELAEPAAGSYAKRVEQLVAGRSEPGRAAPRIVIPEMKVRLTRKMSLDVIDPVLRQIPSHEAGFVFWPARLPTSRHLTSEIYRLLRCAPDIVVCGAGMRDHVVDRRYGQPMISLDEYRHRIAWAARTILTDFRSHLVFILNPPVRDGLFEDSHEQELRVVAAEYASAAREEVTRCGGTMVDLSEIAGEEGDLDAGVRKRARKAAADAIAAAIRKAMAQHIDKKATRPFAWNRLVPRNASACPVTAPVAAKVAFDDGSHLSFAWPQSQKLLLSLRPFLTHRKIRDDDDDVQVDSATVLTGDEHAPRDTLRRITSTAKLIQKLGGRNECEGEIQRYLTNIAERRNGEGLPRVLIVGDSIRMRLVDGTGYARHAYEQLNTVSELFHIPHNCGGTRAALIFLDNWLSVEPDIVHINAGLHDLARATSGPEYPAYATVPEYEANLVTIIKRIRESGSRAIIWGTNTPVDEEWHRCRPGKQKLRPKVRSNEDIRAYNEASISVMKKLDVPVTDMFTPLWDVGIRNVVLPDGVHLNHRGAAILGAVVAAHIKAFL